MSFDPSQLDVWILAGQSNMQGCGPLQGAPEAPADIMLYSMSGEWEPAREPLHKLWESYAPVHQNLMRPGLAEQDAALSDRELAERENQTRKGGAGLGITFATEYQKRTGRPVGLIAAAHGGTSLDQWSPAQKSEGTSSLYGAMLDRAHRAGGNLRGILWYQGESDCGPENSATYADRFDAWVDAARQDLQRPDLPIIVSQLSRLIWTDETDEARTSWNRVREAQRTLPTRRAHTAVAPAIDLPLSDSIHVGTPGLVRLGRRMAQLAQALETGTTLGPAPEHVHITPGFFDFNFLQLECSGVSGQWTPATSLSGFSIHTADGGPHPILRVVEAFPAPDGGGSINVLLNGQPDQDTALAYGQGLNPYCNVVDEADMALPTFAPIPVQ